MKRAMVIGAAAVALAAAGGGGAMLWSGSDRAPGILPWEDRAAVARGEEIYAEFCASCHGAALQGEADWRSPKPSGLMPAPPQDETGHTWHHPDTQLFTITKFGIEAVVGGDYKSDMQGYDGVLDDSQILEVLAFIKSRWPAQVLRAHERINADAELAEN